MPKGKTGLSDALSKKQESHSDRGKREAEAAAEGTEPTKRLNVKLRKSLHERFRQQCESEGRSMTWVITQFIEDYVSTGEDA